MTNTAEKDEAIEEQIDSFNYLYRGELTCTYSEMHTTIYLEEMDQTAFYLEAEHNKMYQGELEMNFVTVLN